jgi:hypothetical protein
MPKKAKGARAVVLSIRTDEEVRDAMQVLAGRQDRTVSWLVDRLMREHAAANGIEVGKRRRDLRKSDEDDGE